MLKYYVFIAWLEASHHPNQQWCSLSTTEGDESLTSQWLQDFFFFLTSRNLYILAINPLPISSLDLNKFILSFTSYYSYNSRAQMKLRSVGSCCWALSQKSCSIYWQLQNDSLLYSWKSSNSSWQPAGPLWNWTDQENSWSIDYWSWPYWLYRAAALSLLRPVIMAHLLVYTDPNKAGEPTTLSLWYPECISESLLWKSSQQLDCYVTSWLCRHMCVDILSVLTNHGNPVCFKLEDQTREKTTEKSLLEEINVLRNVLHSESAHAQTCAELRAELDMDSNVNANPKINELKKSTVCMWCARVMFELKNQFTFFLLHTKQSSDWTD